MCRIFKTYTYPAEDVFKKSFKIGDYKHIKPVLNDLSSNTIFV